MDAWSRASSRRGSRGLRYEDLPERGGRRSGPRVRRLPRRVPLRRWRPRRGARASPTFCARRGWRPTARRRSSPRARRRSRRARRWPTGRWRSASSTPTSAPASRPYPFAVTAPLALAEARGTGPGEDLALAIVIGYEVMGRVFRDARSSAASRSRSTSRRVYGTFGAAAGVCTRARTVRRSTRTTRSGSPPRSPAARSKVTRKARGSAR